MQDLLTELRQLEQELHHAGISCSAQRINQLLHPQFHEVGRSGRVYTREVVVQFLSTQLAAPKTYSDQFALMSLSADSLLLTYRSAHYAHDGAIDYAYRCSIWVRNSTIWQLLYHQGTAAAEGWVLDLN